MILGGRDEIRDVPPDHWLTEDYYDPDPAAPDRTYARRGAFVPEIAFDPVAYGIVPNAIAATDTTQLLALVVADQVLRDCSMPADRDRVSVILGATAYLELVGQMAGRAGRPQWLAGMRQAGVPEATAQEYCDRIAAQFVPWQESTFPGLLPNVIAGRVASRFDLHGTNHTTDAACASALAAICNAVDELTVGRADLVIAGGADTLSDPTAFLCFAKTPALSPTGDCRPFSDQADGTMLGQGVVMFALKRLADAERDGDHVYAVIAGTGTASDGRGGAIYAPLPQGQQRALHRAYEAAGYGPDTVELVEAHGTGTRAGDRAEFSALTAVFSHAGAGRQACALGSIKSQIGHAKGAAGAAGLLKAILALQHKTLPPTIKVDQPNSELDIENSPFYLNTEPRPWVHAPDSARRAAVSSFGFGGSNFHVTLQEYVQGNNVRRIRASPAELILLSSRTLRGLAAKLDELAARLDDPPLAEVARRSQELFDPTAPHRLAFMATASDDVMKLATALADGVVPREAHYAFGAPMLGQLAFLFPGQGAQYVGMGAGLAIHLPAAQRVWDQLGTTLFDGEPLHRVVFPPPAFTDENRATQQAKITATEWAQPALAAHSLALSAVLAELGLTPRCVAGHSFGELIALHVAGAYDATTLMALARRRGELMRAAAASAPGGMLAIGASATQAATHLAAAEVKDIWVANSNAPDQTILSGTVEAIDQLAAYLSSAGVASTRLRASAAFHSPLVAPAAEPLTGFLATLPVTTPGMPVYGNADGAPYPAEPGLVRGRIGSQLRSPVLFQDQIEAMYSAGVRVFVEVGPSGPLTGLVRRILGDRSHLAVALDRAGTHPMAALYQGLGQLAVNGAALNWRAHWSAYGPPGSPVGATANPPPKMGVTINGANYGRPYPPPPANTSSLSDTVIHKGDDLMTDDRAQACDEVHRRAAESHARYQQLMTDAQLAFLRVCAGSLDTEPAGPPGDRHADPPGAEPEARLTVQPEIPPRAAVYMPETAPAMPTPEPADTVAAGQDVASVLMSVVADRTGYPVEVLEPSMRLEADLGIDSIKKVEILAGLRKELGTIDAPNIELAAMRSLQDIIDKLQQTAAPASALEQGQGPEQLPELAFPKEIARFELVAAPATATGLAMPGLYDGAIMVADDGSGLAALTANRLNAQGIGAVPVASCTELPGDAAGVVLLGGLATVTTTEDALATQRQAFRAVRGLARQFGQRGGVLVIVQDTGGDFGLGGGAAERAWTGGLAALARTAAKEWPKAAVKAIDCATRGRPAEDVAAAIATEIVSGGPQLNVGLRADGSRVTVREQPAVHSGKTRNTMDTDSVLVVSGGARGVTAACLIALARACQPRIALLGRTEIAEEAAGLAACRDEPELISTLAGREPGTGPAELRRQAKIILANREIRATMAALDSAGSPARYLAADVTDITAVESALETVRAEWGPVTGIVHAAGELADKWIGDKSDEQFDRAFGTKTRGLRALLAATSADPLRTICVFSSVVGQYGNQGQCDYAMGNEVLAQVASAEAASRTGCDVISIAWGPWRGGMVTEELAARFGAAGVALIDPVQGADAFVSELAGGSSRVVIAAGGAGGRVAAMPGDQVELASAEVLVTRATHPQLTHHVIEGLPVLPMAQVLEWFTAAAKAWCPEAPGIVLRDVRVLRKVALPGLAGNGQRFTIRGTRGQDPADLITVELYGDGEHPHYRALIDTTSTVGPVPGLTAPADLVPARRDQTYDGATLFHGPLFQVLTGIEGVSLEGAKGTVTDLHAMGWPAGTWQTDPAAIDGGVQLAVVWAEEVLGEATLPMAIGEFRPLRTEAADGPIGCLVRSAPARGEHVQCHVALTDADGRILAELRDLELVRRPR
jgi:acyl transferase domain-containing protein/acyl carrier protein